MAVIHQNKDDGRGRVGVRGAGGDRIDAVNLSSRRSLDMRTHGQVRRGAAKYVFLSSSSPAPDCRETYPDGDRALNLGWLCAVPRYHDINTRPS